jgi:hypothetical protein
MVYIGVVVGVSVNCRLKYSPSIVKRAFGLAGFVNAGVPTFTPLWVTVRRKTVEVGFGAQGNLIIPVDGALTAYLE